jgi:hypothetical protein
MYYERRVPVNCELFSNLSFAEARVPLLPWRRKRSGTTVYSPACQANKRYTL